MALVLPYRGVTPRVHESCFVAPNATIIGDVVVGAGSSIWFGAVLRGDVMPIRIGKGTSIQDNAVVHATGGWAPTHVGDDVTVGHGVILHGCAIRDRVLVGMGSIVLDGAVVEPGCIIGAGSLIATNVRIPSGVLALGRPARPTRELTSEDLDRIRDAAELYVGYGREYREALTSTRST